MKPLRVSEIFGPTIQGEGPLIGHRTLFVRLGGCDFRCSWCDTPHAVLPQHRAEWTPMKAGEIIEQLKALTPDSLTTSDLPIITLSGGNPAVQDCWELVLQLKQLGYRVAAETQGSVDRPWLGLLNWLIISPKPPSAGTPPPIALKDCIRRNWTAAHLKFVVADDTDLDWAQRITREQGWLRPVYLQPCNPEFGPGPIQLDVYTSRLRWLMERVAQLNWQQAIVLPQLHVLAWGNEKGR